VVNFDSVARPYRWAEYATFGPALARCRRAALPAAAGCRRALVLGDGDGRFTAELLAAEPRLEVDSVDLSAAMLRLADRRTRRFGPRIRLYQTDARDLDRALPPDHRYDLIATHFFLDCLTSAEVNALAIRLIQRLEPGARWCISEFATPNLFARGLVRALYFAFRVLTGLKVSRLPDYERALEQAGFQRISGKTYLGGLLATGCWQATTLLKQDSQ
jgi:ubiquinone/menaquinone biosynthesis C-methylase UbiE